MPPGPGPSYLALSETAVLEFRAHGHAAHAKAVADRALAAYEARGEAESPSFGNRADYGRLFFAVDRIPKANAVFRTLAQERPDNIGYQGHLAVTEARLGHRDEAIRIDRELAALDRPYLRGSHTFQRARIAAALGENATALQRLRDAFQQGLAFGIGLHCDIAFESLRNDPGFQEILRPKG